MWIHCLKGQHSSNWMKPDLRIVLLVSIIIFHLSWISSCAPENKESSVQPVDNDGLESEKVEQVVPLYIDSVYLNKLEESFQNNVLLTNYQDSVTDDDSFSYDDSFVETKLDINGDGVEDYLVLGNSFHHVWGSIIDGKTGSLIEISPSFYNGIFWNRPYPEERDDGVIVIVVDVDCSDGRKDLQVIFQSGSLPGSVNSGAYLEIYHYNADSSYIDIIFNEEISQMWDEDNLDTIWNINYSYSHIDVLYKKEACLNEIIVSEANGSNDDDIFDYNGISIKNGGQVRKFVYDSENQKYQEQ